MRYKYRIGEAVIVDSQFNCTVVDRYKEDDGENWYAVRCNDFDTFNRTVRENKIQRG